MAEVKVEYRAHGARYERPYVALVNGKPLLDSRGAMRRFKTVVAALDAGHRDAARGVPEARGETSSPNHGGVAGGGNG